MLIIYALFIAAGNPRVITGKVIDDQGTPLAGVNITVKNSSRTTITDIKGEYQLSVLQEDKTLVFSFVGYKTREVKINGRTVINVTLHPEILALEEDLEVVTYAVQPKMEARMTTRGNYHMKATGGVNMAYDSYIQNFNTEGYSTIHENGYKDVLNQPLSTFSIDVDRASYSNVRRFINMGQLPPVDAVRIEEMINYFGYHYPEPKGEHPFSVYTELSVCPWNKKHQLLHVGLQGKKMEKDELPNSNLVFLLDVSGSMSDYNKLPLLKSAFQMLVKELRPEDRVAIVVYAGAAGLVLESTPGNEKEKILESIERLQAGGSTAGGAGLKLAYKVAEENFIEGGNNRIILATDGDFNVGVSSNAEMERLVEVEREKGIFITVLGFGMGNYKDDKMEIIADKGNGNYAYIDNILEAKKVFINELGATLFNIAKDVKIQVEFNPAKVSAYRLIGYENRMLRAQDFKDDTKDAGELGAGHTVTALYQLIPVGVKSDLPEVDELKYQETKIKEDARKSNELMLVKFRYKKPDGEKSILIEKAVGEEIIAFDQTSNNFRFSASVAGFGLLLRDSEYKGNLNLDRVIAMAKKAKGEDPFGYRNEFITLLEKCDLLVADRKISEIARP